MKLESEQICLFSWDSTPIRLHPRAAEARSGRQYRCEEPWFATIIAQRWLQGLQAYSGGNK